MHRRDPQASSQPSPLDTTYIFLQAIAKAEADRRAAERAAEREAKKAEAKKKGEEYEEEEEPESEEPKVGDHGLVSRVATMQFRW